jgi:hypothetical protein
MEVIMHEVSLNRVITDYLTGLEIMDTTYEDLRQALAKLLVEDRKYPRELIRSKYELVFTVNGEPHTVAIDLAVFNERMEPLLALFFCPGEVGTFVRESLAAARIHQPAPFPLVMVTDSMELHLVEARSGELLGQGFNAVPRWDAVHDLAAAHPCPLPGVDRLDKERRILAAYDGLGGPCCGAECST